MPAFFGSIDSYSDTAIGILTTLVRLYFITQMSSYYDITTTQSGKLNIKAEHMLD